MSGESTRTQAPWSKFPPPLGLSLGSPQVLTRRASHNGAFPRWALLLASNDSGGDAAAMLLTQQTALSGEEQRYAGTSPAVAGITFYFVTR